MSCLFWLWLHKPNSFISKLYLISNMSKNWNIFNCECLAARSDTSRESVWIRSSIIRGSARHPSITTVQRITRINNVYKNTNAIFIANAEFLCKLLLLAIVDISYTILVTSLRLWVVCDHACLCAFGSLSDKNEWIDLTTLPLKKIVDGSP